MNATGFDANYGQKKNRFSRRSVRLSEKNVRSGNAKENANWRRPKPSVKKSGMLDDANARRKKQNASVSVRRKEKNVGRRGSETERRTRNAKPDADLEVDQDTDLGIGRAIGTAIATETVIVIEVVAVVAIAESVDTVTDPRRMIGIEESPRSSRNSLPRKITRDSKKKHLRIFYEKVRKALSNNQSSRSTKLLYRLPGGQNQHPQYNRYVASL